MQEEVLPPPASPPSPHDEAESPLPPASCASSPSNSISHSPTQPQKKAKTVTDLTWAQEEDMLIIHKQFVHVNEKRNINIILHNNIYKLILTIHNQS